MNDEFPVFDDEWAAGAQHREPSVADRERQRRSVLWAHRRRQVGRIVIMCFVVSAVSAVGWSQLAGDRPTPTRGEPERLRAEVTPATPSSSFTFSNVNDDASPIRYDPCRPVRIAVNPNGAPPEYARIVDRAIRRVSIASGLVLELEGESDEPPSIDRLVFDRERYGDRWAPVLIAWTDSSVIPDLMGDVGGIGGSTWTAYEGEPGWYVSGFSYVDRDLGDDENANESVLVHELGHVLGLGHVGDPAQIMYPRATATDLGDGDLAGLALLGAGACAGLL